MIDFKHIMNNFKYIDLFCGIGGFHQALSDLGGECVYACDIDRNCREVYYENYGIMPDNDITKVDPKDIPDYDMLCAGFPCQAFSIAGKRLGFEDPTKGTLFFEIMRIAKSTKPKYMLLENVRNLVGHDHGNTWKTIYNSIVEAGYNTSDYPIIFSPHYIRIPQHRERCFILCVRNDINKTIDFDFDKSNIEPCPIDSILQDDSEIDNIDKYRLSNEQIGLLDLWNEFIKNIKSDTLPSFPIWTEWFDNVKIVDIAYPKWKKDIIIKNLSLYAENKVFLDRWLTKAKKNLLFFGAKAKLEWQAGNMDNPDIWSQLIQFRPSGIRIKRNDYFPALVAINQTSIIGKKKRYITLRECARLQSFPDTFKINENDTEAYKQFGNSVNVDVVKLFAKILLK